MKIRKRLSCFLKSASNRNWTKQQETIECRSSRLRISLLKRIPSVNPVRNSRGALIPAGITPRVNPALEQRDIISNEVNIRAEVRRR